MDLSDHSIGVECIYLTTLILRNIMSQLQFISTSAVGTSAIPRN